MKGSSAEPIDVYEVTGLGPLRTRLERAAGRGFTKFVGREHEMARTAATRQIRRGRGTARLSPRWRGPGVGKSRLLFEFKAKNQSRLDGARNLLDLARQGERLFADNRTALMAILRSEPGDDGRKRREKVTGPPVGSLTVHLEDTLAYLFNLLGIVEGDDPLAQMDGQIRKRRTLEAIKRIISKGEPESTT